MTSDAKPSSQCDLSWKIQGMDCGSCATKIRTAVEKLPGVSDVKISTMSETLSITLDESATARGEVAARVNKLGYQTTQTGVIGGMSMDRAARSQSPAGDGASLANVDHDAADHGHEISADDKSWYETGKGRLVLIAGSVLLAAWASKLLFAPAVSQWFFVAATLIGVAPVAKRAFAALRTGIPFTIEMLMTIATTGALFINAVEEAALVVFLFAVGEVLEGVAANKARTSIKALADLVPKSALVEHEGGTREIAASALEIGQIIVVRPGDRIPADGAIIAGTSSVDESPVTGESVPKTKTVGEQVFAGSINAEALLRIRVEKAAKDNTIARIIQLVEEAQDARAPTERFIDRFSRYYMPTIVGLALLIALVPPLFFDGAWQTWVYRALALLLIGCPCALVISVPASIASALSAGARHGLLMKGGSVIEAIATIKQIAFDKTGTLTAGRPVVTDVLTFDAKQSDVLALAAALEAGSSHPLAEAILAYCESKSVTPLAASNLRAVPGRGVEASVDGSKVFIGSPRFALELDALQDAAKITAAELESNGKTVAVIVKDGTTIGLIALRDESRQDAPSAIKQLKMMGINSIMLTGDNKRAAKAIAGGLGLDYRAELLPQDKVSVADELSGDTPLMMIGDGINDAPALASATVGIAMGSGTDVALETADGALLRNRVGDVVNLVDLARQTMSNIHQNIAIALGLKAVLLVTTVLGITGLWLAILADTGATVLVTLNALRLLAFKDKTQP